MYVDIAVWSESLSRWLCMSEKCVIRTSPIYGIYGGPKYKTENDCIM